MLMTSLQMIIRQSEEPDTILAGHEFAHTRCPAQAGIEQCQLIVRERAWKSPRPVVECFDSITVNGIKVVRSRVYELKDQFRDRRRIGGL